MGSVGWMVLSFHGQHVRFGGLDVFFVVEKKLGQ
jgi:heme/copper-type cytochrome/quinol oxidase subunit 3